MSYHIQDLRLVLPSLDFDLRVNKHCAKISAPFREWLQELLCGDVALAEELFDHKFDLLCSLCFPTIDPPQLLRVSKLCTLTFLASDGHIQAETSPSQWLAGGSTPHPNLLNPEHLLEVARPIRTRRAQELQYSPSAASGTNILLRFTGNILSSFYSSQETDTQSSHLGVLEFSAILQNVYDRTFSEELIDVALLATLWRCTTNIIVWSQDLASYTSRHLQECDQCTVCYSIKGRGFILQAAVNDTRRSIQSEVGKFVHNYKSLTAHTCDNEDAVTVANAMRDCIAGFIHWIYESERYFGKRYEEVSKFGWVFTGISGTSTGGNEMDIS
ncbi:hypothetical protein BDM02DRAFT_3182601 [Thelephora ganbajun]|uniref:Uncharacterized protein n=1 Tax=Thelephora ganbajun TaxID=370292 RepID=A0ACB6ZUV6_THEGA|nr:hypothetical protein BDM02DRAFT_3182601 [Thelephora ganbajun]